MFNFIWNTIGGGLGGGARSESFFLGELGAGSGANNHIDFDNNIILFGKKIKFVRASSQGISIANAAQTGLSFTGDFTVIHDDVVFDSLAGDMDLFDKLNATGNQRSYIWRASTALDKMYFYASSDGATLGNASVDYEFETGVPHQLAMSFTAASHTLEIFIDGVSIGTAAGTLPTSIFVSTADVSIGILSVASSNAMDGSIGRTLVYSAALSEAQVAATLNNPSPSATNLVLHLKYANNLTDETANNNDFSPINAPTYTGAFSIGWEGYVTDQEKRMAICSNQAVNADGAITFYNTSRFLFTDDAGDTDVLTHTANFEDAFGYIELKRDDDNLVTAYFNGTAVGTATVDGEFIINRIMGGADDSSATYGYSGGMRNFKIYSRLLSEAESLTNQNGGHVSDGCELWYKMNEKNGPTVTDYSGNGRTGTLENNGTHFFQTVASLTNLVSNGGFNVWNGTAFPNDLPTGWAESSAQSATNYFENSGGRMHLVSDGTSLGFVQTVIEPSKAYRIIFSMSDITSGNIYVYQGSGNNSLASITPVVGQNVWDFTGNLSSGQIGFFRVSGAPADDIILDNAQVFRI